MEEVVVPEPKTVQEVEELVKRFYHPGSPQLISKIEQQLQRIQRSPEGWRVADALLSSDDRNVRFFGALTFTVKLNLDWKSLDEMQANVLLLGLLGWLIRLVHNSEPTLVLKKLCSTLVTYFTRQSFRWRRCIKHLVCAFLHQETIPEDVVDNYPPIPDLVHKLNELQLQCVLWFATILVEEVGKLDSRINRDDVTRVALNLDDATAVMHYALNYKATSSTDKIRAEGFNAFAAWVYFGQREWSMTSTQYVQQLRTLIMPALECVYGQNDEAVDGLTDMLRNYGQFFQAKHLDAISTMIRNPTCLEHLSELQTDVASEAGLMWAKLLLAFGDVVVQDLVRNPNNPASQQIMEMIHQLLRCPGVPGADDEIAALALEFWNTFIEYVVDSGFADDDDKPDWIPSASQHMLQAVEELWAKIRIPPTEVAKEMDSESKKAFVNFRRDVGDLLQTAFQQLSTALLERFARLALDSLHHRAWEHLEASLVCLNALADSVFSDGSQDEMLGSLLGSSLFSDLTASDYPVPGHTIATAVDLLGHLSEFFERHTEFLPQALDFLFFCLTIPRVVNNSAKSISELCSSCRASLTSSLDGFFSRYLSFQEGPTADPSTKEKVMGAIAAIVQALASDEAKVEWLERLLDLVGKDVLLCLRNKEVGQFQESQATGASALRCLVNMGKAFQVPDDSTIDLTAEPDQQSNFWIGGPGSKIQKFIVEILSHVTAAVGDDAEIIEEACQVLRCGYTETLPGPFVLPPQVTVDFILRTYINTPRVNFVLSTACIFLTAHSKYTVRPIEGEARAIVHHVFGLIQTLGGPSTDPEVSQSCVDVLSRIVLHHFGVFVCEPAATLEHVLNFTIQCLLGPDVLPKRSAASLWVEIIDVTANPLNENEQQGQDIINHFGKALCDAIVFNVSGEAARSELDHLCPLLKKLVQKQRQTKTWLEASILGPSFRGEDVDEKTRRRFLQQIISARGSKSTNDIVRNFWIECRGLVAQGGYVV